MWSLTQLIPSYIVNNKAVRLFRNPRSSKSVVGVAEEDIIVLFQIQLYPGNASWLSSVI